MHKESETDYTGIFIRVPGLRSGKPCIRGMRITVEDIISYQAAGMQMDDLLDNFPDLTPEDIKAANAYVVDFLRNNDVGRK